jgi:hypothetical protein
MSPAQNARRSGTTDGLKKRGLLLWTGTAHALRTSDPGFLLVQQGKKSEVASF